MNKGYVSLYRKVLDNPIWNEKPFDKAHAWLDLIVSANYKTRDIEHNGKVYKLGRGELIVSKIKLAERWGWSRPKVYRFFDYLLEQGMIENVVTPNVTPSRTENVTPNRTPNVTPSRTENVTQLNNNNKYINNLSYKNTNNARTREEREDENIFSFSSDNEMSDEEYENSELSRMMKRAQESRS